MPTVVSREDYFDTALRVLARSGFPQLNIRGMCGALGVSTGSFYHHFGGWNGFVAALLAHWELRQKHILHSMRFGDGTTEDDIVALRTLTLGLPHAAEAAIRTWAISNPLVETAQRRVDQARYDTVRAALARIVGSEESARVLATLGMSMLVGFQQLLADGEESELDTLLDRFVQLVYLHA